jgi:hypothetical protein
MVALGVKRVHVLGSNAAVTDAAMTGLPLVGGVKPTYDRWAGGGRYATAVDIANKSGLSFAGVGIATGQNYPDALAGGVMQGKLGGVLLLTTTSSLSPDTATALTAHKAEIGTVRYLGSSSAVGSAVRTSITNLLK